MDKELCVCVFVCVWERGLSFFVSCSLINFSALQLSLQDSIQS